MSDGVFAELRAFYVAIASGNIAAAEASISPDRFVVREAPGLPYGGDYHGVEGFRELFRRTAETWKGRAQFDDLTLTADGKFVISRFLMTATLRATGRQLTFPVVEVLEMEGGKIVSVQPFYWDTHGIRLAMSP